MPKSKATLADLTPRFIPDTVGLITASSTPGDPMDNPPRLLPVNEVRPNGYFLRDNAGDVEELAESIREQGLLQPIVVRPLERGGYEVIAGNRRYAAVTLLGWATVPATVRELDDKAAAIATAIENFQRVDLTVAEEARMYDYLADALGIPRYGAATKLAELLHRDNTRISRVWRLAKHPDLTEAVSSGEMTLTAALAEISAREGKPKREAPPQLAPETPEVFHGEKLQPDPAPEPLVIPLAEPEVIVPTIRHYHEVEAEKQQIRQSVEDLGPLYHARQDLQRLNLARIAGESALRKEEIIAVFIQIRELVDRGIEAAAAQTGANDG